MRIGWKYYANSTPNLLVLLLILIENPADTYSYRIALAGCMCAMR